MIRYCLQEASTGESRAQLFSTNPKIHYSYQCQNQGDDVSGSPRNPAGECLLLDLGEAILSLVGCSDFH